MNKPTILTGLRANKDLHIGNYFGALLPLIDMAKTKSDDYQINLFVPDLHSFTTPVDHSQLQSQIMNNLRLFVASGLPLDNLDVHIYRQSYISAHSELMWILGCFTGFRELRKMTQFKEKDLVSLKKEVWEQGISGEVPTGMTALQAADHQATLVAESMLKNEKGASVGLFNYPILMAADILLYGAKYVPVGDDQSQHIEFTRDIGEKLNSKFERELFSLPEPVQKQHEFFSTHHSSSDAGATEGGKDQPSPRLRPTGQGLRIKDLVDPSKKMSKSDESGRGIIFLGDKPEDAHKKIIGATTDDKASIKFDPENQPGISNLLQILSLLEGRSLQEVDTQYQGQTQYGEFKKVVAEMVAEFLRDFQNKLAQVDQDAINTKLESSEKVMNEIASATLLRVQKAVGLR